MTKAYLVARIARDHPDILARMKAGEFVTVRQAAIAAGILKDLTRLDQFQKLWRHASDPERKNIAVDVIVWRMWQNVIHRDQIYAEAGERMAARQPEKRSRTL